MGLLDALFQGSQGGGSLLDFLKNNALNQPMPGMSPGDQAQYGQPMSAMAQAPQFAPAMAQQNPQPSPLDTAQYPYGPVGAPSQANAQMPPQQPPPVIQAQPTQPPQDTGMGIGDRLGAGFRGFAANAQTGPIGAILGGVAGLAGMGQGNPANLTAKALLAKGVDPTTVQAAINNPELMKTLVAQVYGQAPHTQVTDKDGNVWDVNQQTGQRTIALQAKDDKFQHVAVKNPDGSETLRTFNTKTGEYSGEPAPPAGRFAVDPDLTGQARLDALRKADPDYARRIEAMVNGDIPLPTGVAALKPNADRMIKDVLAVDGATSASDFATRASTRRDYASGVASRVTKSLNTTIEHAGRLDAAIDKLNNYTYFPGVTNWVHDKVSSNTDPEYQKAKSDFESAKEAFIKELDFTLSGGHSSVSGSAELRDKINRADSPETLHAAIQTDLHLLSARLDSHTRGFNEGTKSQRDQQDFLYPKNRPLFNKLMGSQDTSTGQPVPGISSAPAAPPASPKPGAYVWSPDKGLSPQ